MEKKTIQVKHVQYEIASPNEKEWDRAKEIDKKIKQIDVIIEKKEKGSLHTVIPVIYQKVQLSEEGMKIDMGKLLSQVQILNDEDVISYQTKMPHVQNGLTILYMTELELLKLKGKQNKEKGKAKQKIDLFLLFMKEIKNISDVMTLLSEELAYMEKEIKQLRSVDQLEELETKLQGMVTKLNTTTGKYLVLKGKMFEQLSYFKNEKLEETYADYKKAQPTSRLEELQMFIDGMLMKQEDVEKANEESERRRKEQETLRSEYTLLTKKFSEIQKSNKSKVEQISSYEDVNKEALSESYTLADAVMHHTQKWQQRNFLTLIDRFKIIGYQTVLQLKSRNQKSVTDEVSVKQYASTLRHRNKMNVVAHLEVKFIDLQRQETIMVMIQEKITGTKNELIALKKYVYEYFSTQSTWLPEYEAMYENLGHSIEKLELLEKKNQESIDKNRELTNKGKQKVKRMLGE